MSKDMGRSLPAGVEIRSLAGLAGLRPSQRPVVVETPVAATTAEVTKTAEVTQQPTPNQQSSGTGE